MPEDFFMAGPAEKATGGMTQAPAVWLAEWRIVPGTPEGGWKQAGRLRFRGGLPGDDGL